MADRETDRIDRIDAELNTHGNRIKQLKKMHDSLNKLFQEYRDNINDQINNGELGIRFNAIETDVARMRKLHSSFDTTLESINDQKEAIDAKMAAFEVLDNLKTMVTDLKARCDKHDTKLVEHVRSITEWSSYSQAQNAEIQNLKDEIESIKGKHAEDVQALRNEMQALVQASKEETLDEMKPTVQAATDFEKNFTEFEKKMRSHVAKGMKRHKEKTEEVLRTTIDEMRALEASVNEKNEEWNGRVGAMETRIKEAIVPDIVALTASLRQTDAALQSTNNKIENDIRTLIANSAEKISDHIELSTAKFGEIDAKFAALDEFNGNTTVKIREINETIETKDERMTGFVKEQVRVVAAHLDEHKKATQEKEDEIGQSIEDLDNRTTERITKLTKKTKKHFITVNRSHEKAVAAHESLKTEVQRQGEALEQMQSDLQTFKEKLAQDQVDFVDKMEKTTNDISLTADAAKRTMASRCDDLENEINLAKKHIGETKVEIAERFAEIKAEHQRATDSMKTDLEEFKIEVRRLNTEIRQQNDMSKKEIFDSNASQFEEMEDIMKSLSQALKEFK